MWHSSCPHGLDRTGVWLSREKAQHPLYFQTLGCLIWLQRNYSLSGLLGSLSCVIALNVTVAFTVVSASDFSVSSCFLSTLCPSEAYPPPFQIVVTVLAKYDPVE